MICIPAVALLPDLTYVLLTRIYFPTPTEKVLRAQRADPHFKSMASKK